jgi:hypothetical protein
MSSASELVELGELVELSPETELPAPLATCLVDWVRTTL